MVLWRIVIPMALAALIIFLQVIAMPGVAESFPIIRGPYVRVRKGFEKLYETERTTSINIDDNYIGETEVGMVRKGEDGFHEISEALKNKLFLPKSAQIEEVGILYRGKLPPPKRPKPGIHHLDRWAYITIQAAQGSVKTIPFLSRPTENRLLESWVQEFIQRRVEKQLGITTMIIALLWASLNMISLSV